MTVHVRAAVIGGGIYGCGLLYQLTELGWTGVATIAVFVALTIETLIYVWKRGALDWNPPRRRRYVPEVEEEAA